MIWPIKDLSNNNKTNNANESNFKYNNNLQPKGRKLIEDFNKFQLNKSIDNENEFEENCNKHQINNNNSINNNYNISNNNFSFLTPNNKIEKEKEKKSENKNENEKDSGKKENSIQNIKNNIIDNSNSNNAHNMFFTDYGLGYKCNCQKTQCNKYYCQCYREGRYCFNCNCTDCQNQKPQFCASNKHQDAEEENKDKKTVLVACTCTKSGCNKNYCECYKAKVKCTEACRCRNCENCDYHKVEKNEKIEKNTGFQMFECCPANSVFIIKNKIVLEDIEKIEKYRINNKSEPIKRQIKLKIDENILYSSSSEDSGKLGHKRKRINKTSKETEISSNSKKYKLKCDDSYESATKKKNNDKDEYSEGDLFDKDGKLILTDFKF